MTGEGRDSPIVRIFLVYYFPLYAFTRRMYILLRWKKYARTREKRNPNEICAGKIFEKNRVKIPMDRQTLCFIVEIFPAHEIVLRIARASLYSLRLFLFSSALRLSDRISTLSQHSRGPFQEVYLKMAVFVLADKEEKGF